MGKDTIVTKKKGDAGNRIIAVQIRNDILESLDEIATESNHSRNELINIILQHGIEKSRYNDSTRPLPSAV